MALTPPPTDPRSSLPPPPPPPPGSWSSLPPPPPPPAHSIAATRWGLGDAFIALAAYLASAVVVGVAFLVSEGETADLTGPWLPAFVLIPQVAVLGYVAWAVRTKGRGLAADLQLRFEWIDLPTGAAVAFAGLAAASAIGALTTWLLGEDPTAAVADLVEDSQGDGGITVWIVLVAVFGATLVPLSEEILFRGLWWSALEKRGMRAGAALVSTSVVFAAFHLEPFRFPMLVTLGLALGWGRIWTSRIGASIVAHGIINGLAFTALLVELS